MSSIPAFDGSIPSLYDRLLGPMIFEPYARDMATRVPLTGGTRVLEVACGTGRVTRHLIAGLTARATLTASDLSAAMLAEARVQLGNDPRVTWQEADAMALPFADGSFDSVVCQFGVMFFPDKAKGIRELHRVLAPGGRLAFSTWDSMDANPFAAVISRVVRSFFVEDPPTFYDIPFSMHDRGELEALAVTAGFTNVRVQVRADTAKSPRALDAATGFVRGNPMINALRDRKVADVDHIVHAVAGAFREEFGDGPMRASMQALIVTGRRSARVE